MITGEPLAVEKKILSEFLENHYIKVEPIERTKFWLIPNQIIQKIAINDIRTILIRNPE